MASGQFSVGSSTNTFFVTYTSSDAQIPGQAIVDAVNLGESNGTLTATTYTGTNGALPPPGTLTSVLNVTTASAAAISLGGYGYVIDSSLTNPTVFQGGAAGFSFLAGSGSGSGLNVSLTNITPSGSATDNIVVTGGDNFISTSTSGGGNYLVETGNGNDTINILTGNGTVNAGTGYNSYTVGTGSVYIYSEGYDSVTGSSVAGGGTDTVNIGSGGTSINSGFTSFLIQSNSHNRTFVTLGAGVDTVQAGGLAPVFVNGQNMAATVSGAGTITTTETSTGDAFSVTGGASSTVVAGKANETIVGAGSGNNLFVAGSGNDSLVAGAGADTLKAGSGNSVLQSGTGSSTTFSFIFGAGGGSDTINGFKANDILQTVGYGNNPGGTALTIGHSTIVTLSDGTTVTINGVTPTNANVRAS